MRQILFSSLAYQPTRQILLMPSLLPTIHHQLSLYCCIAFRLWFVYVFRRCFFLNCFLSTIRTHYDMPRMFVGLHFECVKISIATDLTLKKKEANKQTNKKNARIHIRSNVDRGIEKACKRVDTYMYWHYLRVKRRYNQIQRSFPAPSLCLC